MADAGNRAARVTAPGWFRLKNGEKALVSLTDRHRAVYVPTSRGYALLVSPAEPDSFLAALRRVAPAS